MPLAVRGRFWTKFSNLSSPEDSLDLVVVSYLKEDKLFFGLGGLEKQPEAKSGPAFEKIRAQLSDSRPLMGVGETPSWHHGQQGLIHRRPLLRWKLADLAKTTFRQLNPPGDLRRFR